MTDETEEGMQLCINCGKEKFMHSIVEFYLLNDCKGFVEEKKE